MKAVWIASVDPPFSMMTGLNFARLSIGKILARFSMPNSHSQRQRSRNSIRRAPVPLSE